MPSTIPHRAESAGVPAAREPRWPSRPHCRRALVGAVAGIAGLALLIAGWSAVPAGAKSEEPDPAADGANVSDVPYEQCVEAAFAAFGPAEEASSAPSDTIPDATGDPAKSGHAGTTGGGAIPDPPGGEEVHPNSPAHEMCTEDCPEDEQCPRPTEFTIVRDENVETISFENPEPEGDPAAG